MSKTLLGYPERLWVQLALAAVALLLAFPAVGGAVTVQAFPVPSPAADLQQIVAGPDGALWFTEKGAGKVGRITTADQIAEYPIPNNASGLADTGPTDIVSSGGGLWFLTDIGESTYRIATNGTFSLVYSNGLYPAASLAPSDTGGVWLMQSFGDGDPQDGDALVRVDPDGTATDYPATHPNHLYSIAKAPGGSVWFNNGGNYLDQMTDAGAQISSPLFLPSPNEVSSIAFAPNGTLWFTDYAPNSLTGDGCCGGIDELAGGVSHRTPVGVQQVVEGIEPDSLTTGPDGALWFAFHKPPPFPSQMNSFDGVGRIDPVTGQVQLADTDPYVPGDIAFGSDGALWFVDNGANDIGRTHGHVADRLPADRRRPLLAHRDDHTGDSTPARAEAGARRKDILTGTRLGRPAPRRTGDDPPPVRDSLPPRARPRAPRHPRDDHRGVERARHQVRDVDAPADPAALELAPQLVHGAQAPPATENGASSRAGAFVGWSPRPHRRTAPAGAEGGSSSLQRCPRMQRTAAAIPGADNRGEGHHGR